jgi:glycosyltransferase involved in cell wall biosynthesis
MKLKINFLISKNKIVGGENVLKIYSNYSKINKNIYYYTDYKSLFTNLLNLKLKNELVCTTLQKNNILNMFFSILKNHTPVIRETFLYEYRKDTIKNRITNRVYGLLLKISKPLVIVQSENMKRDFKKKFNYKTLIVINNPIDPIITKKEFIKNTCQYQYISYVGRLVKDKGVHILIRSYLKSSLPQKGVKLLIAGNGSYKNYLIDQASGSEMIIFLGNIEEPLSLIKNSEFLVLPSLHEGFPNILLEAMGLDTLFLSNNIPSVKEMCFNDNSFLYDNEEELIHKLNSLISLNSNDKDYLFNKIKKYKEFYNCRNIIKDFDKKIGEYVECH